MNKRKWFYALLLALPLLLAVPLYFAATWKPHPLGVHPITGKALPPFVPGMRPVPPQYRLMITPDGSRLLSISTDATPCGLAMWDVARARLLWKKPQTGVSYWKPLCFSPDSKTLAMSYDPDPKVPFGAKGNPKLALFEAATGRQIAFLPVKGTVSYFQGARFARDQKQLIAATNDSVRTWDVSARREVSRATLQGADLQGGGFISDVTLAPDSSRFLVNWSAYGSTPTIHLLGAEMRDPANRVHWKMPGLLAPNFAFSPDGSALIIGDQNSQFEVRDAPTGRVRWKKKLFNVGITRAWLPDSSAIALDVGAEVQFLDAQTGAILRSLPQTKTQDFVIAPDGNQLYCIGFAGEIWRQRLR